MEKEEIIKEVTQIIRQHLDKSYKIFLFGSWAKGTALETSDLDIAILGAEKVPWETISRIKGAVGGIPTLRSIDIVDLQTTGAEFKNKVLEQAKELD